MTQFAGCAAVCCVPWDTAVGEVGEQQQKGQLFALARLLLLLLFVPVAPHATVAHFFRNGRAKRLLLFFSVKRGGRGVGRAGKRVSKRGSIEGVVRE